MNKLVIDVGGTALKYALMDNEASILEQGSIPTPMEDQKAFLEAIYELYLPWQSKVDGIALSLPGRVDTQNGFVYSSGALLYNKNTPLAKRIQDYIGERTGRILPVSLENDGKTAAAAEMWKGNLQGVKNGIVLILGTGLGGGLVLNGEVYKGNNFFAGELSFLSRDMLEITGENSLYKYISTSALISSMAEKTGQDAKELDGYQVFECLEKQDPGAVEAFEQLCQGLGSLIFNLTCLLDPDRILLGGGISRQPKLLDGVLEKFNTCYTPFLTRKIQIPKPEVNVCRHFNDANLIGALYTHLQQYGSAV